MLTANTVCALIIFLLSMFHWYKNKTNYPTRWIIGLPINYAVTCYMMWLFFSYEKFPFVLLPVLFAATLMNAVNLESHVKYIKWDISVSWLREKPVNYMMFYNFMIFSLFAFVRIIQEVI